MYSRFVCREATGPKVQARIRRIEPDVWKGTPHLRCRNPSVAYDLILRIRREGERGFAHGKSAT